MSKAAKDLAIAIKKIAATTDAITAKVIAVDKTNNTCDVAVDGGELGAVRLQSVADQNRKGFVLYPARLSDVVISQMDDKGNWVVILFSEIEELAITIEGNSFRFNKDGLVINNGTNGGLLKLAECVQRWNKIEDDINALKSVFKTWVVIPADGGGALKTAAAEWFGNDLIKTKNSDVENTSVKH